MLKIFKYINVVGLVKKIMKYGDYIKLIADTAKYFHDEGISRGIISPQVIEDTVKAVTEEVK
jgi:hypothetical protein